MREALFVIGASCLVSWTNKRTVLAFRGWGGCLTNSKLPSGFCLRGMTARVRLVDSCPGWGEISQRALPISPPARLPHADQTRGLMESFT